MTTRAMASHQQIRDDPVCHHSPGQVEHQVTALDRPKSLLHDVVSPVTFHLYQLGQRQPVSQTQLQQHRLLVTLLRVEDLMVLDG